MAEYKLAVPLGELYPVLLNAKGETIDGFHRLKSNPKWKKLKLENIDSEEKTLLVRLMSNKSRRIMGEQETRGLINQIAALMEKRGGPKKGSTYAKDIAYQTGYEEGTIMDYLDSGYKVSSQRQNALKTPHNRLGSTEPNLLPPSHGSEFVTAPEESDNPYFQALPPEDKIIFLSLRNGLIEAEKRYPHDPEGGKRAAIEVSWHFLRKYGEKCPKCGSPL